MGAHSASLLGSGGLAGADGPDGLVGDDHAAHLALSQASQSDLHLIGDQLLGDVQLALLQALAHAHDGTQTGLQGGVDLLVDGQVGLVVVLTALGVADDDVLGAHFLEHLHGDLTGESTGGLVVAVLAADGQAGVLEQLHGAGDVHSGNTQHHFAPLVLAQLGLDGLGVGAGLGQGLVHLPVAGDDGLTIFQVHKIESSFLYKCGGVRGSPLHKWDAIWGDYLSSRQATPGSSLPSRNSREAPPPVEMWVILSAKPS